MQKELNVTILNVLRYDEKNKSTGEKTGKQKIRIGYFVLSKESMQNTDKFKGYAELSVFLDYTDELWNKLSTKIIMQPVEFVFEQAQSLRDPLKTYLKLNTINCKDEVINLV